MERLDVPFYLHPGYSFPERTTFLEDHPWLSGSAWGFTLDTATHALRQMGSRLFDKYPKLTIILGHLGETLPFLVWRIDNRIGKSLRGCPAKKKFNEYFKNNFYVTTSGQFCTQSLPNTMQWLGADRILFSVDYPFEKMADGATWFDNLNAISDADWVRVARSNAEKLLKLGTPSKSPPRHNRALRTRAAPLPASAAIAVVGAARRKTMCGPDSLTSTYLLYAWTAQDRSQQFRQTQRLRPNRSLAMNFRLRSTTQRSEIFITFLLRRKVWH